MRSEYLPRLLRPLLAVVILIALWQLVITVTGVPRYILPAPLAVGRALIAERALLAHHAITTVIEILGGLIGGVLLGLVTALSLARFRPLRRTLLPLLLVSQAIPLFALAPILMLWLGYGLGPKILMAMIIIYFPVASTGYDGLRQTPQGWLDLARTFGLNRRQVLFRVQLPAALPSLASGLRMAASAAPIGAVIGEWVGASRGLGFLMLNANARLQIDVMFAALVVLVVFAILLYFGVDALLRLAMPWHRDGVATEY
ncbi:ABC transporter permease [Salinicola rhizosphaerae]|uniref:ABC transporter permease n=1 Tax=Salinicola rhizosphaerae TaxID=1443141 RepID=A0ABQ3DPC4_9GAMM|nr:ABC transporter permease [Salinicola rhizosphaerae]GHB08877.1 ABC transporter permease [Salinicola rhizosphaerae]